MIYLFQACEHRQLGKQIILMDVLSIILFVDKLILVVFVICLSSII